MPPRGHYFAQEAGGLAGVSGNKIGQWARRGYIRASQSSEIPLVYAYQDIAEAMVVHELEVLGVSHKEILETTEVLRVGDGLNWPLLRADLAVTIKKDINPRREGSTKEPEAWLLVERDGRYVRPSKSKTQGLLNVDVRQVTRDLQRGGWAVRDLPDLEHVEVNPDRLSGRPTIRGRRVPADDVAQATLSRGRDEIREAYDLSDAQIDDAVRWWTRVQEYEAA